MKLKSLKFHSRLLNAILTAAAILFSVSIVFWLVYRQWDIIVQTRWSIHWEALGFSFLIYTIDIGWAAYIWVWIIRSFGVEIHYLAHFRAYCVSNLARRLPGTIWYVAYRAQSYRKTGFPAALTTLASGIEEAILVISGVIICALFAIPLLLRYQMGLWGAFVLVGICIVFLQKPVLTWLLRRFGGPSDWFNYRKIIQWISAYVLLWMMSGSILFSIANIFYPIDFEYLGTVIGSFALVGVLSQVLLFSPFNFGLTEVGLSVLLSGFLPSPIAVIIALANRILVTIYDILWAVFSLLAEKQIGKVEKQKE